MKEGTDFCKSLRSTPNKRALAVAYAVGQDSHKFGGMRATVSQRTARECLSASCAYPCASEGGG